MVPRLTVCGLDEVDGHCARGVTHILSILDPTQPDADRFLEQGNVHRTVLRFHDEIEESAGIILPTADHIAAILNFGAAFMNGAQDNADAHVLIHCHAGVSRSTAAMATLLAQLDPERCEDEIFTDVLQARPQAWPNCLMIDLADEFLGRGGRLVVALGRLYAKQLTRRPELASYLRENGRGREVAMAGF